MESKTLFEILNYKSNTDPRSFTEHYSHLEVHQMAGGFAAQMATIAKGKPVCICTGDRAVVAAALLAGLQSGTPLILPHASSKATLTNLRKEMPYNAAIVDGTDDVSLPANVRVLTPDETLSTSQYDPIRTKLSPDSPWVYLFTGGSTGKPKFWTKTPANLLSETDYLIKHFNITDKDRILATAPPNHIYGLLFSVLIPLVSGACVCATTPGFPHEIINTLSTSHASILVSLPVHYRSLKAHAFGENTLRLAFSSAGPLDPTDGDSFSTATGAPIYEIYGSTETGGIASRCRHHGETELTPFEPVSVAVEVDGAYVTSAFISPDLPRDEKGRFLLADRVEATNQGRLRLMGRSDGIVKVGGKRVDLEMVREALKANADVSDAVVFSLAGDGGRKSEIVAVVEGRVSAEDLRKTLQSILEPYAQPRRIKVVEKIPMFSTGKYDRLTLHRLFQ